MADLFDLYTFRIEVASMYAERNRALAAGRDSARVADRWRQRRDRLFATHPQSALDAEQRAGFHGLDYFPYDPAAVVIADVSTDVEPQRIEVVTSGQEVIPLERVARLQFEYRGQPAALSLFWIDVYGGGLFLPVRDGAAPDETYGGGRYLFDTVKGSDFGVPKGASVREQIVLDFNYAYNPSCAYNPAWVCPLAPAENRLPFAVRAGERVFGSHAP